MRRDPRQRLLQWHRLLRQGDRQLALHLQAARAALPQDPIAPLRRQALALLERLGRQEPGEGELAALAALHRAWGDLAVVDAPALARDHYEQAWACGAVDRELEQCLANLAWREGLEEGAWALAPPEPALPPWAQLACPSLGCGPCQELLQAEPQAVPEAVSLELTALAGGRIWCNRANPWGETYGVAVADGDGRLLAEHCRSYPWHWPACASAGRQAEQLSLCQLTWWGERQPPPQREAGAVLAVADLSAELHYHWQLELLPRLGLAWQQLQEQEPNLRLWHNGGGSPRVREALERLGIPPERVLDASTVPHLQAEQLWIVSWPTPFGAPGRWAIDWLREFWGVEEPSGSAAGQALWLPRRAVGRRPLLEEQAWQESLREPLRQRGLQLEVCSGGSVAEQLQRCARVELVIAPHGGAMANLLAASAGTRVLELVNPAYAPPYLATTLAAVGCQRWGWAAAATPEPLAQLLYAGALEWPIAPGPIAETRPSLLAALDHTLALSADGHG